jgi:integrase
MATPAKFKPFHNKRLHCFEVNIPPHLNGGVRSRRRFKTLEDAWQFADTLRQDQKTFGTEQLRLDRSRIEEATGVYAFCDAQNVPYSLFGIVRKYWEDWKKQNASISLLELLERYYDFHQENGTRPDYLRDIRTMTSKVIQTGFGKRSVSEISGKDLDSIVKGLAKTTKIRYRTQFNALFEYAIGKDWAHTNPAKRMERFRRNLTTPRIFDNGDIEGMLNLALEKPEYIEMIPLLAIGAFTGIRINRELPRMYWSDINWELKKVIVRAEVAKNRRYRDIPLRPNLEAWLKAYLSKNRKAKGKLLKLADNEAEHLRVKMWRQAAPGKRWITRGLRKTFCSQMLNNGKTAEETREAMGHSVGDPHLMFRSYVAASSPSRAEAFWNIFPSTN